MITVKALTEEELAQVYQGLCPCGCGTPKRCVQEEERGDLIECEACCSKGFNWGPEQVGPLKTDIQELRQDCDICLQAGVVRGVHEE